MCAGAAAALWAASVAQVLAVSLPGTGPGPDRALHVALAEGVWACQRCIPGTRSGKLPVLTDVVCEQAALLHGQLLLASCPAAIHLPSWPCVHQFRGLPCCEAKQQQQQQQGQAESSRRGSGLLAEISAGQGQPTLAKPALTACVQQNGAQLEFYDTWVARDMDGNPFTKAAPYATDPYSLERVKKGLPFPVKCCWNGLIVMNARPFTQNGLRIRCALLDSASRSAVLQSALAQDCTAADFVSSILWQRCTPPRCSNLVGKLPSVKAGSLWCRMHKDKECAASECSHLCTDFMRTGHTNFVVDPGVRQVRPCTPAAAGHELARKPCCTTGQECQAL